jgi:hypothetical protein
MTTCTALVIFLLGFLVGCLVNIFQTRRANSACQRELVFLKRQAD